MNYRNFLFGATLMLGMINAEALTLWLIYFIGWFMTIFSAVNLIATFVNPMYDETIR